MENKLYCAQFEQAKKFNPGIITGAYCSRASFCDGRTCDLYSDSTPQQSPEDVTQERALITWQTDRLKSN